MGSAAREEVARTVLAKPGKLRRGSAATVLALLSASALAPVAVAVAGGSVTAVALAGIAGNIGSDYLAGVIEKAAGRLRRAKQDPDGPNLEAAHQALAAELLAALEKDNFSAYELRVELTTLLTKVDGFMAALNAAEGDLHAHLAACFDELIAQQRLTLRTLREVGTEQRRQNKRLLHQIQLNEEISDQLRRVTRLLADRASSPQPGPAPPGRGAPGPAHQPTVAAADVVVTGDPAAPSAPPQWRGGAELEIEHRVYLIHDDLLEEEVSADRSTVRRQARGSRLVPAGSTDGAYVWLRQVRKLSGVPAPGPVTHALRGERDLLLKLGKISGLPRIDKFAEAGGIATLSLHWPASRAADGPCDCLAALLGDDDTPIDPWRRHRLFAGLAQLCDTLARLHEAGRAHRFVTPAGLVILDNGRLALRDLGLAAHDYRPGEGRSDYQAPEQRRRGGGAGPYTDVYRLAAVTYHVITGRPPHPARPLPVRTQAPDVPERISRTVDAALAADPAGRPDIAAFRAALRAGRNDLP